MYKVALGAVLLLFIHMWVKEVLREEENNEKRKEGLFLSSKSFQAKKGTGKNLFITCLGRYLCIYY